jgi:uncharacterized membrane protein YjfL (UPF0719 family)
MDPVLADLHVSHIVSSLLYSVIGIIIFVLALLVIDKVTPYSIHKEIEEEKNVALGLVIGSMLIGLAIIISAAIQ